jgi:type IV pilus assembly protein PilB
LLGDMLLERGLVTEAQITTALGRQKERGHRLGECLLELGYLERIDLFRVLAEKAGVEYIDLQHHTIDLGLAALIPEDVARRFQALPIERRDDTILVAMDTPENIFELDDLRVITEYEITPMFADPEQLAAATGSSRPTGCRRAPSGGNV